MEREYIEIRTHLLGEHLFKDSQVKYTNSPDTSATWRPDDDQRRPAAINGEGIEETPAFAKASAVAKALADKSAGKEGTEG